MKTEYIIIALQTAKLYEAAKLQCGNVDNLSMLVAVATGKVATYKSIAEYLGCRSSQAIGQAMKRNPYPRYIFPETEASAIPAHMVPCHRVVASDLTIGGLVHHLTMNN
jgi:methylated-DNA-[protein]-cysteine S-methyltransferase